MNNKARIADVNFLTKNLYNGNYKLFESPCGLRKRTNSKSEINKMEESRDNLFLKMRGFLIFGRVLGIIPVSGVFSKSEDNLKFSIGSFPAISNLIVTGLLTFSSILSILESVRLPKSSPLQIAFSIQGTVFRLWALFNYIYFLLRADSFISLFKSWSKSKLFYPSKDETLKRDIILIPVIAFTTAALESATIHMEYFPQLDKWNGHSKEKNSTIIAAIAAKPALQTYYERSHGDMNTYFGYHPLLAVIGFISHKYVVACWVYVDTMIILFARALYWNFKRLKEVAEAKLEDPSKEPEMTISKTQIINNSNDEGLKSKSCWNLIVKDHDTLCSLVDTFEHFLSPLIFGSYSTNIYYICMQLIEGLSPDRIDNNLIHSIFAPLSFLNLLLRIYLISLCAARVNTFAHQIGMSFKKCPIELYDAEVARVDKHVTSGPDIGLSGLGTFTVTKPFLLNIINVVFTVEIVLLQGISIPSSGTSCPPNNNK